MTCFIGMHSLSFGFGGSLTKNAKNKLWCPPVDGKPACDWFRQEHRTLTGEWSDLAGRIP